MLDDGDVIFSRSTDYGATWQTTFQIDGKTSHVVNDDNDGVSPDNRPDDVAGGQVLPRLVVDELGNVDLIWYDTAPRSGEPSVGRVRHGQYRRWPDFLSQFPRHRSIVRRERGRVCRRRGRPKPLSRRFPGFGGGGSICLRGLDRHAPGNQDIYFRRYSINPIPDVANDRYEPNNSTVVATDLGRIVARDVPKLAIGADDEDWFRVTTAATGSLSITATGSSSGDTVRLELFDETGTTQLATGTAIRDANGRIVATSISYRSQFDRTYLVRIVPGPAVAAGTTVRYALAVRSQTADLGTHVNGVQAGKLSAGDELVYPLGIAAAGSLVATLTPGANASGTFHLEVLAAKTFEVLVSGDTGGLGPTIDLRVAKDQSVYLRVTGDAATQGDFVLAFANPDQFSTNDNSMIFFPTTSGSSEEALADLNGDGALDIVISHVGQDIISVLINNGDGTYKAPRTFAIGAFQQDGPFTLQGLPNFHRDLAIDDFNRDGIPDIVVVNTSSGDVSLLLGNGDGTFQPQRRFDATSAPFALAAGDLNNDGIPDLAVIDSTVAPAKGGVLLGRGDGTFQLLKPFVITPEETYRTNSVVIVDINGDGMTDLVVRDFSDGTVVLLGHGDGTFELPSDQIQQGSGPASRWPTWMATAGWTSSQARTTPKIFSIPWAMATARFRRNSTRPPASFRWPWRWPTSHRSPRMDRSSWECPTDVRT